MQFESAGRAPGDDLDAATHQRDFGIWGKAEKPEPLQPPGRVAHHPDVPAATRPRAAEPKRAVQSCTASSQQRVPNNQTDKCEDDEKHERAGGVENVENHRAGPFCAAGSGALAGCG